MTSLPFPSSSVFEIQPDRLKALPNTVRFTIEGLDSASGCAPVLPDVDDFFWEKDPSPILDTINAPIHLKNLSSKELKQLADEVCSEISFIMSRKCQPCGPGRAVLELTCYTLCVSCPNG